MMNDRNENRGKARGSWLFSTLMLAVALGVLGTSCTKEKVSNKKVLRIAVPSKVKGFDPIFANDLYSGNEVARVFEGLLQFHYLKRPYTLEPNLAASMPTVSNNGLTYTFKLKKGVLFHDDAAFEGGKGRELVADDVVFSIKRLADPKLQSTGWWILDGKIKGLNEWRAQNSKAKTVDYSAVVEGIKALDSHTVQFTLTKQFPQFLYALAMPFTLVVAKEVVAKYGKEFLNHPVGTGPFKITRPYGQTNKIKYVKFDKYRSEYYPSEGTEEDKARGLLKDAGKRLPLVDELEVSIVTEVQPRWLSYLKGKFDYLPIPKDQFSEVINPTGELQDSFEKKGIDADKVVRLDVTYYGFNHMHPLFKDNEKLRQAMSLAFDREKVNKMFYMGISIPAQSILPPGLKGHVKGWKGPYQNFDLEAAKKKLAEAGYPEGKGLPEITLTSRSDTQSRQQAETFKLMMAQIGIKIKLDLGTWPELQKKITNRSTMMYAIAWGADYPDAENFFKIVYGPNKTPGANGSNFDDPKFNKMFEEAALMQDSPERTAKYEEMYKYIATKVPHIWNVHRVGYTLKHGWFRNYKFAEIDHGQAKYFNVDLAAKEKFINTL